MSIELLLLGYAGILLHYAFRWKELVDKKINADIPSELPSLVISLIITTVLIYVKDDIKDLFVVTEFGAFLLGYSSQSIFNRVVTAKMPKDA